MAIHLLKNYNEKKFFVYAITCFYVTQLLALIPSSKNNNLKNKIFMKKIKLFAAIIIPLSLLLFACNGNKNNANVGKGLTADNIPATTSSSPGDAVFSYNLDGTKISGGDADAITVSNVAYVTQSDNGNKLSFFLNDAYKDNTETVSHSLRFAIPGKTGTTALTANEDNFNVQLFLASGEEGKYVMYANEGFSITVTNISATHVSGTFSGKLKLFQGAGKDEVTITDGKFDIPVRPNKG